jgi:integrase
MKGEGSLYRRNGIWWITIYHGPADARIRHRESLNTTIGKVALDRAKAVRRRLEAGPVGDPRVTVGELLDELLTHLALKDKRLATEEGGGLASLSVTKYRAERLKVELGKVRAEELTTARIEAYQQSRFAAGRKPATVKHDSDLLRQAFRLAWKRTPPRILQVPHIPTITVRNARQGFLSRADFQALLAAIKDPDLRDYLEWFWWTGMRPKEIRSLTWEMLDTETWTLHIAPMVDKTRKGRTIPVRGPLLEIAKRRLKKRRLDTALVFHRSAHGKRGAAISDYTMAWATALKDAGLPATLTPYDLRRTALRNMLRAGTHETVVMKISGHRSRHTFDRYNITSTEDLEAAIDKTKAYVDGLPTKRKATGIRSRK